MRIRQLRILIQFLILPLLLFTGCAEKDDPITGTPPELPGSDVIYPAVLYRGELYYWERLSHKPLPQPLTPIGEIEYIGEAEPDADLQFIGMFQVNGTAYFYAEEPDILYVCLTTDWMSDTFVMFNRAFYEKYPFVEDEKS
ncbi:MAG: hypothetical protein ACOX42_06410 [Clostridia bacterium]|jgi:hypothetical protein